MKTKNCINRIRMAAAAAGVLGLMLAAPAPAADSIAVPVSATVVGVCKFSTPQSPSVTIENNGAGGIDPTIAGNATGNAAILYKCTSGTSPTFALTGGATLTLNCGTCGTTPTMNATMSLSAPVGPGLGFGAADQSVTLTGTIPDTTYGSADVGTYSASQTVTVTP